MPTLLDLVGAETPGHVQGASLSPLLDRRRGVAPHADDRPAFVEATSFGPPRIGIRTATRKYVFIPSLAPDPVRAIGPWKRWDDLPVKTLYDLERDPEEKHNVAEERPEETASFHRLVEQHVAEAGAFVTHHKGSHTETSGELQDELRELGYIE
jgi:arylsulfatase A-like enzyme